MYESQLLKVKIRAGKTDQVVEFLRTLQERGNQSLEAMRREGMMVESMFLERQNDADYLYYFVKAKSLLHANEINLQSTDALTLEIRKFISETWGHIVSPEPLLDLDLIPDEHIKPLRTRRKTKPSVAPSALPHALSH